MTRTLERDAVEPFETGPTAPGGPGDDHLDDEHTSGDGATIAPAVPPWTVVIRCFAFLRKELMEIARQPKLIALLVIGPFVLLMLFGFGYDETSIDKRVVFVGTPGSIYETVLSDYEDQLDGFVDSAGMVPTLAQGRAALHAGDVDVVVVFPERPLDSILVGERAEIDVLHDEIDPLQERAIEIAARVAIQEVNATVLATITADLQAQLLAPTELGERLRAAADLIDDDALATRDELRSTFDSLAASLDGSRTVLGRLGVDDPETIEELDRARAQLADLAAEIERIDRTTSDGEIAATAASARDLADTVEQVVALDPNVLVRPFTSDTDNVLSDQISSNDYFTPGSLALLLQHLALTFAALSLVRDRRTGLFELMRVGPLSSIEIIVGKIFAYLLVGSLVAAALVAGSVVILGVPMAGSLFWLAVSIIAVLVGSMAMGMVLAVNSGTESQAVQFAMLALLAGLFFSGFALPIEGLSGGVRVVSWLLPVTYGIDSLQDVMLRGVSPAPTTLAGLGALIAVYGTLATIGLKRQLSSDPG